jgi:hypothetical protein
MNEAREATQDQDEARKLPLETLQRKLLWEIQGTADPQALKGNEKRSWDYFMIYLTDRLQNSRDLFEDAFDGTSQLHEIAADLQLVLTVARSLNNEPLDSLSLDELANRLFTPTFYCGKCKSCNGCKDCKKCVDCEDCEKAPKIDNPEIALEVAFHVVGWLTGIWDPVRSEKDKRTGRTANLKINSAPVEGRRPYWLTPPAVRHPEVILDDKRSTELHNVLRAFGRLLPLPKRSKRSEMIGSSSKASNTICRGYLAWHTLESNHYQVKWTSTLSEHLQVDTRHQRLYLYQHPSLIWLLSGKKGRNILTTIFDAELRAQDEQPIDETGWQPQFENYDFFDQVLRSYRLLFASASIPYPFRPYSQQMKLPAGCDPFLADLCSRGADPPVIKEMMKGLDHEFNTGDVVRLDEYEFIWERLEALADLGRTSSSPTALWRLWTERFHPNGWPVMRWVTLFLIVATLGLQFLQTVLQSLEQRNGVQAPLQSLGIGNATSHTGAS